MNDLNYKIILTWTCPKPEDEENFIAETFEKGCFSFNKILPIPKEIYDDPIITQSAVAGLTLMALKADPNVKYYGEPKDKMSQLNFYNAYMAPFQASDFKYNCLSEEIINFAKLKESSGDKKDESESELTRSINVLKKLAGDFSDAKKAYQRMIDYKCATRYAWRSKFWGTPMEVTGYKKLEGYDIRPNGALIFTIGGNAMPVFDFIASKFYNLDFKLKWETVSGETSAAAGSVEWEKGIKVSEIKATSTSAGFKTIDAKIKEEEEAYIKLRESLEIKEGKKE